MYIYSERGLYTHSEYDKAKDWQTLRNTPLIFGSPSKIWGYPMKIWGLQWKSGVSHENLGFTMKIWGVQWKSGVSNKNLGFPMKIWGFQWKSGVSNENLGSQMKIWGLQWKSGVSNENLGSPMKICLCVLTIISFSFFPNITVNFEGENGRPHFGNPKTSSFRYKMF